MKNVSLTIPAVGKHHTDFCASQHILRHREEVLSLLKDGGSYGASHNTDVHSGINRHREPTSVHCCDHHCNDRVVFPMQGAGKRNHPCRETNATQKKRSIQRSLMFFTSGGVQYYTVYICMINSSFVTKQLFIVKRFHPSQYHSIAQTDCK